MFKVDCVASPKDHNTDTGAVAVEVFVKLKLFPSRHWALSEMLNVAIALGYTTVGFVILSLQPEPEITTSFTL